MKRRTEPWSLALAEAKEEAAYRFALDSLAAYRLQQVMSVRQAMELTRKAFGRALWEDEESWTKARDFIQECLGRIKPQVMADLRRLKKNCTLEPFTNPIPRAEWDFKDCPKKDLVICWRYETAREVVRVGKE